MMKLRLVVSLHLFLVLTAVSAFAMADTVSAKPLHRSNRGAAVLTATLLGANEVPGPGDPDGRAEVVVTLNQARGTACFALVYQGIATPTRGHIHAGAAGVAGPIVVDFFNNNTTEGPLAGCVTGVSRDLIAAIRNDPSQYYFNVHNVDYPEGALRGQLTKLVDRPS